MPLPASIAADRDWWRHAVVYQIYPRSFADSNGDGVGDINGIRSRLPYLAGLGIDAIWINPWYPSPMKDAGYDVSDYRAIEPVFGTMADAEALLAEAHDAGIRVILDIVPNHTSDQHRWFQAALAAGPGSPERDRFIFRDGRGPGGDEPPNDWMSEFGGPAWTRVTEADGRPGQWYLRLFAPEQPDVNWNHPDIHAEFEQTLRFWFDRGVDGFRIDVAHGLVKDADLRDLGGLTFPLPADAPEDVQHPHWDQPGVHDVFREWRSVADSYAEPKAFCGEIWVSRDHRLTAYLRPDELHTAFNFNFLQSPWRPADLRRVITSTLASHAGVGAPATWVLGNHDVCRPASRYARPQEAGVGRLPEPALLPGAAGRPRARPPGGRGRLPLLSLALPGAAYVYGRRGARPARGRGHPRRCPAGPDVRRHRRRERGPRRLPGPRCPGRPAGSPSGSARRDPPRRGCRSRPTGGSYSAEAAEDETRRPPSDCTDGPWPCAPSFLRSATATWPGSRRDRTCSPSPVTRASAAG